MTRLPSKRGNGQGSTPAPKRKLGSVFQRASTGRWGASVTLSDGRRITRYVPLATPDPERQAHQLLAKLITETAAGESFTPTELTVERWLAQYVLRANRGKAQATIYDRERTVRLVNAELGKLRLDKLTPARIQDWLDSMTLSQRSRIKALQLLRGALSEAVALGHLTRNPATPVSLPRVAFRQKGSAWTTEEARAFLTANEGTAHVHIWRLALQTGARIGEILALKVSDFDGKNLHIQRTITRGPDSKSRTTTGQPKTAAADRIFPLPPDACATIQAQVERRAHLATFRHWNDEGWLFCSEHGGMLLYDNVHRAWKQALKRAKVPTIRTHDLRVTFISLTLRRGVKPEVVSRMVGHTSPLITLRVYRHIYADEMEDARDMMVGLV